MKLAATLVLSLAACGKAADHAAPSGSTGSAGSGSAGSAVVPPAAAKPPAAPAKAQVKDDAAKQLIAKGTSCELRDGDLPLDCAEYKAIGDYAFQHQSSVEAAETCASFLGDPNPKKRLLAAECLFHFNAMGKTSALGFVLDAIETEQDPKIREREAWGIMDAEAVTAKLDDRVLALVTRLAADPKGDVAAGYLFGSLFPQYLMGHGPKPPAKAQALAIEALGRDGTGLQREAFNAVTLLDDKPAVCAALDAELRPDAKQWASAAEAVAAMKDACVANLAKTIDFVLARLAAGDDRLDVLRRYDSVFDLDAATRTKIARAIRKARAKAPAWQRKSFDETAAQFEKPAKKR